MNPSLTIGLPVMLHKESEIQAFLAAKERIEEYGRNIGRPLNVGAFLFFIPPAMKPENLDKQLENQSRYRVPIVHAQSTFQSRHCLAYGAAQDQETQGRDLVDLVVNQTAALHSLDDSTFPVYVSVNVGLYLSRTTFNPSSPVVYTLGEFSSIKEEVLRRTTQRFSDLEKLAREKNIRVAIENGVTTLFAPHIKLADKTPTLFVQPFNSLPSLLSISGNQLVFDTAHWAGTRSAPEFFERNKAYEDRTMLFMIEGIQSWNEYLEHHPLFEKYLPHSKAIHIGNATGMGISLEEDSVRKWGKVGVSPKGIVSRKEFNRISDFAQNHQCPLIIEVEYDIPNIPSRKYREADEMIKYIV